MIKKYNTVYMADPNQQLSNLDPKLKEAYDRVMGTPVTTPAGSPPNLSGSPASPSPTINPTPVQPVSPNPVTVGPTLPPVGVRREPEKIQIGGNSGTQTHGYVAPKKKNGLPTVLLVFGGIIFLIVYTIFWLKFFQIPVPYLPF